MSSSPVDHHSDHDPVLSRDLSCDEVTALLPLVADGALDAEGDPALFAHLARCCECQEALMRHDLVTVALERTCPVNATNANSAASVKDGSRRRAPIRHVFLPWPAAVAASVIAAAGLWMWLASWQQNHVAPQAPATQVVQVLGADGQPIYVVVQGEQITVIDPRAIDGKAPASQQQSTPVKFNTPVKP
jgi:anti-sigma factor RsiW